MCIHLNYYFQLNMRVRVGDEHSSLEMCHLGFQAKYLWNVEFQAKYMYIILWEL